MCNKVFTLNSYCFHNRIVCSVVIAVSWRRFSRIQAHIAGHAFKPDGIRVRLSGVPLNTDVRYDNMPTREGATGGRHGRMHKRMTRGDAREDASVVVTSVCDPRHIGDIPQSVPP